MHRQSQGDACETSGLLLGRPPSRPGRSCISKRLPFEVKGLTLADVNVTGVRAATRGPGMNKKTGAEPSGELKPDTLLSVGGRDPSAQHGYVNPPVYHASTLLYPTAEDYVAHRGRYQYGRRGTPTSEALETAVQTLDGPACAAVALLPSGPAAISSALLAVLKSGDHLLVTDSVYLPTRKFCDGVLKRFGVTTTYYDPLIGGAIAELITPDTRAVFCEAPGSLTFETQDIDLKSVV